MHGVAAYYRERTSFVVERLNQIGEKYLHTKLAALPQATFYVFAGEYDLLSILVLAADFSQIFRV